MMTVGRQWERVGLSRTGEVFLVGQDRLMRSDSRFMLQDPDSFLAGQARRGVPEETLRRMRAYRSTILLQELNTFAVRAGLSGDTGTGRYADYRGEDAIVSWAPIDIAGLRLAIVAKIDVADALAPAAAFRRTLALIAAVAVMLLTLVSLAVAGAFPLVLRLPATGAALALGGASRTIALELRGGGGNASSSALWWSATLAASDPFGAGNNASGLVFNLISDKVAPSLLTTSLGSYSVLAIYITVVLTAARLIRTAWGSDVARLPYEETPDTTELLELCEGIRAAQRGDYVGAHVDEMHLYRVLLRIMCNPDLLLRITAKRW
jgi:hypothetical protein